MFRSRPPPTATLALMKSRRDSSSGFGISGSSRRATLAGLVDTSALPQIDVGHSGGRLDGGADSNIGGASTKVAAHGGIDILIIGLRRMSEQGAGGHHLACLAITALHDI